MCLSCSICFLLTETCIGPYTLMKSANLIKYFVGKKQEYYAKNLTLIYERTKFIVEDSIENRKLRGKDISVYDYKDGRIVLEYKARELNYRTFEKITAPLQGRAVNSKRLDHVLRVVKKNQSLYGKKRAGCKISGLHREGLLRSNQTRFIFGHNLAYYLYGTFKFFRLIF